MRELLRKLAHEPLGEQETEAIFRLLLQDGDGAVSEGQIGAYLFATSQRRPTSVELAAAVRALRSAMVRVPLDYQGELLDTCGTGGSGLHAFNTSTVAALVCVALGQPSAKHGNRAATSSCGSADLLEALGAKVECRPEEVARCFNETNFCFMFAPLHHPATRRVQKVRRELGIRTIFNFLGPLANPAGATVQLLGVSDEAMQPVIAEALRELGMKRAMVVRGEDGLDELTLAGRSRVFEIRDGSLNEYYLSPEEVGLARQSMDDWPRFGPQESAAQVRRLLEGEEGPHHDLVCLNAGAALYTAGRAESIREGVLLAKDALKRGAAAVTLEKVVASTNGSPQ